MKAGQFDRTIHIMRRGETLNAFRETVETWTPFVSLRARLISLSTDELITGAGQEAAGAVTFEARFAAGITVSDRIEYAGATYDIKAMAEIGRRAGLTIRAIARPS